MEVSNYIKMRDQMQERFLTYDQKEIEGLQEPDND